MTTFRHIVCFQLVISPVLRISLQSILPPQANGASPKVLEIFTTETRDNSPIS